MYNYDFYSLGISFVILHSIAADRSDRAVNC